MKPYRFRRVVEKDGSVRLSGLAPQEALDVAILEYTGLSKEMQEWLSDIRARYPFSK